MTRHFSSSSPNRFAKWAMTASTARAWRMRPSLRVYFLSSRNASSRLGIYEFMVLPLSYCIFRSICLRSPLSFKRVQVNGYDAGQSQSQPSFLHPHPHGDPSLWAGLPECPCQGRLARGSPVYRGLSLDLRFGVSDLSP